MATDLESTLQTLLSDNWNTKNTDKPTFYYDDSVKTADARSQACIVKVYESDQIKIPRGLGYTSHETETRLTVDIRGSDRTHVLECVDEVARILESKRIAPSSGYDLMTHPTIIKHTGYAKFYHFSIDVKLIQHAKTIS